MGQQQSKAIVMFAKHGAYPDVSSTPGAFMHLSPLSHTFTRPEMTKLRQAPVHPLNQGFAPLRGPLDVSKTYEMTQKLTGLFGNNGAAIDPETTTDIAGILDIAAGTDSIDPAGATATATAAGSDGSLKTVVVSEQARFPIGIVASFPLVGGTRVVRQVRARAGSSGAGALTLDRTFTGTIDDGEDIIRFSRHKFDPSVFEHIHGYIRVQYGTDEGENYLGAMCTAQLDFSRGQYATIKTTWRCTDVSAVSGALPTFVAPTVGSGVVRVNNALWIGDDLYYSTDLKADCGGALEEYGVDDGPHGVLGYSVHKGDDKPRPKGSAVLVRATAGSTSTGEVAENTGTMSLRKAQAWDKSVGELIGQHDIAFQGGGVAGAVCYGTMSSAAITKAEPTTLNGRRAIAVEFEALGSADLTNLAPFEFHLG